ncbi:MAG: hypothetical protein V1860_00490 [bacterium]
MENQSFLVEEIGIEKIPKQCDYPGITAPEYLITATQKLANEGYGIFLYCWNACRFASQPALKETPYNDFHQHFLN